MSALLASILLALLSAVAYAAAAVVQERVASTTAPSRYALLRNTRWWVSVVLNGTGALLHVAALGLGPLTVVQPLGVLTIVIAAPLAALAAKRRVSGMAWRGIVLVSVGLAAVLLFSGAHASRPLQPGAQYLLAAVSAALVLLAAVTGHTLGRRGRTGLRSVALAGGAGIAFGTASVCVKAVAEGWALASITRVVPVLFLIALFAGAGLVSSQAAYRGAGLAAPLATATVVNPVLAGVVGILVLDEGFRHGAPGALAALVGAVAAGWGLFVLTAESTARHRWASGRTRSVVIPAPSRRPGNAPVTVPVPEAEFARPETPRSGPPTGTPVVRRRRNGRTSPVR
ncbi:DMT family transporter [Streptomyces sp. TR02-1]|uniref:DMT family transporter n=1 Tax=Streptomyces sp. TR02-1 TaxID=3385977 RepID=UPI0039A00BA6